MTGKIPGGPLPSMVQTDMTCPLVYPHHYKSTAPSTVMRIDDKVYDLTKWRTSHPGGVAILDLMHNRDATDAFYALHSEDAIRRLKNLPSKPYTDDMNIPRDEISLKFEELRKRLEREGWFKRNWFIETFRYIIPTLALTFAGIYLAWSHPVWATLLLGLGMQQAGWISHDFAHGRDRLGCGIGVVVGANINGFSNMWWSNKHNTHHVFPNRLGIDSDIHNDPLLSLWFPSAEKDVWFRKYQHIYYPIIYSFLFASWRLQSAMFAFTNPKGWSERIQIILHYLWLSQLPLFVSIGAILVSGITVAVVVTANHQVEELLGPDAHYNYVADQYITTRGVICPDPLTEMFFGGMQYQLEHHLFPIMPRSNYAALRPIVTQFAKDNGMEHKLSGICDIFYRNYLVMKQVAQEIPTKDVKKY